MNTKVRIVHFSGDYYKVQYRLDRKKSFLEYLFGERYETLKYFFSFSSTSSSTKCGIYDKLFTVDEAEKVASNISPEFLIKWNERIYEEENKYWIEREAYLVKSRPYKVKQL